MMKFPPYPKYKPSGVEWLGEAPEHWKTHPLKRQYRVVNGGTPSSSETSYWGGDINWITPEDLGRNDTKRIGRSRRTLSLEGLSNCGAQLVPRKSIVISTRAPIGHIAVIEEESCTNQGCRALIPESARMCSDYTYYSLLASRQVLQAAGKGTTFLELSAGLLGLHMVPFPPCDEQCSIADFLDRETAKIDTLVAKKQILIERLKEKRTALISRTVTRGLPPDAAIQAGLDPHPKLKPSGVEWLGEVPEHWEVKRLKMACHLINRKVEPDAEKPFPYIGMENVESWTGQLSLSDDVIPTGIANEFQVGHTLFGKLRPYLAKAYNPDFDGLCSTEFLVLKGIDIDRRVLAYSLLSRGFINLVDSSTYGSKMPRASWDFIGNCLLPIAPADEQRAIADFLDRETTKIDALVAKIKTAVERLQEYRSALITAAVTGKIDIRETAA